MMACNGPKLAPDLLMVKGCGICTEAELAALIAEAQTHYDRWTDQYAKQGIPVPEHTWAGWLAGWVVRWIAQQGE